LLKVSQVIHMTKSILLLCITASIICATSNVKADTFGTGINQFTLDFVNVGNAGEVVSYDYRMGKYEISQNQVDAAKANGFQLYDTYPQSPAWSGDQPAANISWFGAASFVNWLNTSSGHQAAYDITWDGTSWSLATWNGIQNQTRNPEAYYFLPNWEEYYKSAYYSPETRSFNSFSTGNTIPTPVESGTLPNTVVYSSSLPSDPTLFLTLTSPASVYQAGGLSSYGTMGQVGNIGEWSDFFYIGEQTSNITQTAGIIPLGGSYESSGGNISYLDYAYYDVGFRVAALPEPSTYALFGLGGLALLIAYRKRKVA